MFFKQKEVKFFNVAMDEMKTAFRGNGLVTYGVGPCIVLCAQGVTKSKYPVVGLYHWSGANTKSTVKEETALAVKKFCNFLRSKNCVSFDLHLIGGQKRDENCSGTEEEQAVLINLLQDPQKICRNIQRVTTAFNITQGDEMLDLFVSEQIKYRIITNDDEYSNEMQAS